MNDKTQPEAKELATDVKAVEAAESKTDNLSRRDALEVAIEVSRPLEEIIAEDEKQIKKSPMDDIKAKEVEPKKQELPELTPPAEFDEQEKADFKQSPRKAQEAALRLHKSRMKTLGQIQAGFKEVNEYKELAKTLTPFMKSVGMNLPTEVAIKKALMHWNDVENGDPRKVAARILQAKGLKVPQELLEDDGGSQFESKITPLQEKINSLESKITQAETAQVVSRMQSAWSQFENEKNAIGERKYPDITDSESGLALASRIGSLVGGTTDLSRQFIANVQARNPDANMQDLIREAYKFHGGRINEAVHQTGTQAAADNTQIIRAKRASVSQPGRAASASSSANGDGKKYKTYREAVAAALAELSD